MRRNLFYIFFCFSIFVLTSCNQGTENSLPGEEDETGVVQEPLLNYEVESIGFKMHLINGVRKTTLGVGKIARVVSLSPYYIAETEVTQELFNAVMGYNPSHFDNSTPERAIADGESQEKRPVESVSWYDAVAFCNKLTELIIGDTNECVYTLTDIKKTGEHISDAKVKANIRKKGFRLPTEAEYEYAAKGGVKDIIYAGANHDDAYQDLKEIAWFNENAQWRTHEVAKKKANGYGLFDMSGNVFEWCHDNYSRPMLTNVELDPQGSRKDTGAHSVKGGGYGEGGYSQCAVFARTPTYSDSMINDTGFRIVIRK